MSSRSTASAEIQDEGGDGVAPRGPKSPTGRALFDGDGASALLSAGLHDDEAQLYIRVVVSHRPLSAYPPRPLLTREWWECTARPSLASSALNIPLILFSAPLWCMIRVDSFVESSVLTTQTQLLAMDILVLATMKNAAKCDM